MIANTERDVVPNSAVCILATETRARINALLGSARQLHGTIRVELTLRTAIGRLTDHAGLARAVAPIAIIARRVGVRTTGVRVAGIFLDNRFNGCGIRKSQFVAPTCITHV